MFYVVVNTIPYHTIPYHTIDAAGRSSDHSDSDLEFAKAAKLKFYNEKEFFKTVHA